MPTPSKILLLLIGLVVGTPLVFGGFLDSAQRLPSGLGYLKALAEEDDRKIVILLTPQESNDACRLLESEVLNDWEWTNFAHHEIVFETFVGSEQGTDSPAPMEALHDRFAVEDQPTFVVATPKGKVIATKSGHEAGSGPDSYQNWIRSL